MRNDHWKITVFLCILLLLGATESQAAGVPGQLAVQGVLRNAAGQPVDGTYAMMFSLLDGPEGNSLWEEIQIEVPVSGGVPGGLRQRAPPLPSQPICPYPARP